MNNLAGRTAFITGGAQGIGLGMARAFAAEGVQLALADIDIAALDAARSELESVTKVVTVELDVRDRDGFATAADQVEAELGPVTLLCNNAGVAGFGVLDALSYDDWDWVLGININGVVNGTQTFLPRFLERGGDAHIVNTASGAGLVGAAGFLYSMSKFAVVGLSEALRGDLIGRGVGVSVLCPARVATDIVENTRDTRPGPPLSDGMRDALAISHAELQTGVAVDVVGRMVLRAVQNDELYILTDDVIVPYVLARAEAIAAAAPRP